MDIFYLHSLEFQKIRISGPYFKIRMFYVKIQTSSFSRGMGKYGSVGLPSCRLSLGEDATGAAHVRWDENSWLTAFRFFNSCNVSGTSLAPVTMQIIANTYTKHTIFQTLSHSISITILREKY